MLEHIIKGQKSELRIVWSLHTSMGCLFLQGIDDKGDIKTVFGVDNNGKGVLLPNACLNGLCTDDAGKLIIKDYYPKLEA